MKGRERLNQATFRWKTTLPITAGPVGVFHKSERARPSLCVTEYRSWIGIVRVDFDRDHQLATAPQSGRSPSPTLRVGVALPFVRKGLRVAARSSGRNPRLVGGNFEGYLRSRIRFIGRHTVASSPETRMDKLPKEVTLLVDTLCREGDRFAGIDQFDDAIEKYQAAWDLLPIPRNQWPAATWILVSVGDAYFSLKEYDTASEILLDAFDYPDAESNPYLYLRLGQCLLETGQLDDAADALEEAFRRGGESLFEDEDPKYLTFVKTQLKIINITPATRRFNRPLQ